MSFRSFLDDRKTRANKGYRYRSSEKSRDSNYGSGSKTRSKSEGGGRLSRKTISSDTTGSSQERNKQAYDDSHMSLKMSVYDENTNSTNLSSIGNNRIQRGRSTLTDGNKDRFNNKAYGRLEDEHLSLSDFLDNEKKILSNEGKDDKTEHRSSPMPDSKDDNKTSNKKYSDTPNYSSYSIKENLYSPKTNSHSNNRALDSTYQPSSTDEKRGETQGSHYTPQRNSLSRSEAQSTSNPAKKSAFSNINFDRNKGESSDELGGAPEEKHKNVSLSDYFMRMPRTMTAPSKESPHIDTVISNYDFDDNSMSDDKPTSLGDYFMRSPKIIATSSPYSDKELSNDGIGDMNLSDDRLMSLGDYFMRTPKNMPASSSKEALYDEREFSNNEQDKDLSDERLMSIGNYMGNSRLMKTSGDGASDVLAAALEQMDGIIASSQQDLTVDDDNLFSGHSSASSSSSSRRLSRRNSFKGSFRVTGLVADLKRLVETADDPDRLKDSIPPDCLNALRDWLKPDLEEIFSLCQCRHLSPGSLDTKPKIVTSLSQ